MTVPATFKSQRPKIQQIKSNRNQVFKNFSFSSEKAAFDLGLYTTLLQSLGRDLVVSIKVQCFLVTEMATGILTLSRGKEQDQSLPLPDSF